MKPIPLIIACLLATRFAYAQSAPAEKPLTHADTLRGSITPERAWWNVLRYDISVRPDYLHKTIEGSNTITYQVVSNEHPSVLQLDLQAPLQIDRVVLNRSSELTFTKEGNVWYVNMPDQKKPSVNKLDVYYHGSPHEAIRAPWDGGWTFTKDSLGRPWMTVTCQGLGASIWYPCKDHQSDEPDDGASLSMTVPDTLVAVANGKLASKQLNERDHTITFTWAVTNPINNYDIIPYIGKYVNFSGSYAGEKGNLELNYWVLDYNLDTAKNYMPREVKQMLKAFEFWMGPYPFYEDGYKLIDVPHTGMEHQSAVAYGNHYAPGYRGRDGSGTGWGLKWDFIIVHESGHEWFGNNITSQDLADMWIHESFTNYSETLYVDYTFGTDAGNEYNAGTRKGIRNVKAIIPRYNVNEEGSGDMYPKGGNMLHTIRHSMGDDTLFRQTWRGLNKTFYHQTVTAAQIEGYISKQGKFDYSSVFKQYLTTTQLPQLEYYLSGDSSKIFFRYTNCIPEFKLPIVLKSADAKIKIIPTNTWQNKSIKHAEAVLFDPKTIAQLYYVTVSSGQK